MRLEDIEERPIGDPVNFVQDQDQRLIGQSKLFEDGVDRLDLFFGLGTGGVGDVEEQVRLAGLLQRGLERGDERVRQVADEPDGVRQQDVPAASEPPALGPGVEGGEQLVLGQDAPAGQGVHQGRLAGVGVADQPDRRHVAPAGDLALAAALDLAELLLEVPDPLGDEPAVLFELLLAGASDADPALVAGQVGPHPLEAGQGVFELRQLDLQGGPRAELARVAKMSRITSVRSITLTPRSFSRLRVCAGPRSLSKTTRSASCASTSSLSSSTLPEPM